jgi:hypothetical protein
VAVVVVYTGRLDPLRAAGLQPGFTGDGSVNGMLALRDVAALVAIEAVISVAMEPPVQTN